MENKESIFQNKQKNDFTDIIVLCIGTNKVIGDSIGPMVGEYLNKLLESREEKKNIVIYGNMSKTLNLKNVQQILKNEITKYENPFIITIDAALGRTELIEQIFVGKGNIQIGSCLGDGICCYSNLYLKGIVGKEGESNKENIKVLSKVEKSVVYNLAERITREVYKIIQTINVV